MTFGGTSRCFPSDVIQSGYSSSLVHRCYKTRCDMENGKYVLKLFVGKNNAEVKCSNNGGKVNGPQGFSGTIQCPKDIQLYCKVFNCPSGCSGRGACVSKTVGNAIAMKCECIPGYTGTDCSTPYCQGGCSGHGICKTDGNCQCSKGWAKVADCSQSETPGRTTLRKVKKMIRKSRAASKVLNNRKRKNLQTTTYNKRLSWRSF
eukprot:TRINITY_DN6897_c0_g1_i3.p1 TRINITY_DN6897_c0_g1~~TRINITY_DN6897_c0_g1_i3.p1  ORF type:complete len:204 (-),score=47.69 TRINITY_DN6897_c0_g1_i3:215-826(-)